MSGFRHFGVGTAQREVHKPEDYEWDYEKFASVNPAVESAASPEPCPNGSGSRVPAVNAHSMKWDEQ
ncbi:MAG: hypothetical protein QGF67_16825, partial [Lentisphaeria bacterium]|nr:hypothetical protein [Lentisphaeria bacterium]